MGLCGSSVVAVEDGSSSNKLHVNKDGKYNSETSMEEELLTTTSDGAGHKKSHTQHHHHKKKHSKKHGKDDDDAGRGQFDDDIQQQIGQNNDNQTHAHLSVGHHKHHEPGTAHHQKPHKHHRHHDHNFEGTRIDHTYGNDTESQLNRMFRFVAFSYIDSYQIPTFASSL